MLRACASTIPWFLACFTLLLGCTPDEPDCDLGAGLRTKAGGTAANCGHAVLGNDASLVDECVVTAFQNGMPFTAQYDRQGDDSLVVLGVAGDAHGNVTFLLWDSDPSGGSATGAVIHGQQCLGPAVDPSTTRDPFQTPPLTCTSTSELGQTCGP